jgi:L-2,4-diaminobutyrate decarboxylase
VSDSDCPSVRAGDGASEADLFLDGSAGRAAYAAAIDRARDAVLAAHADREGPYSGASEADLRAALPDPLPEDGTGLAAAVEEARERVLDDSVIASDPACAAHLQCPPLIPALAAEVLLTAVNQSLDSWDQAPAATVVEERLVGALCDLFGYPSGADGVFTAGATQSNLQGLLLARNRFVAETFGRDPQATGLPPAAGRMRVLCSDRVHFTAEQAAALLGLGEESVVSVATDDAGRMVPAALDRRIEALTDRGLYPFALIGTAGTTDLGAIDPLAALAKRASAHDLWFHVDAAYGGALALSDARSDRLAGIERADSLAVDFHKLFFQPLSCGAFLLRDGTEFDRIARRAAYLNPEGDAVPNLVGKSLQTSRRFDALKPYLTFRALGRERLATLVEDTLDLAAAVGERVAAAPDLELAAEPSLTTVVFRYLPDADHPDLGDDAWADRCNRAIRDRLLADGDAVVARTELDGRAYLKLTLLDPRPTVADVGALLDRVRERGAGIDPGDGREAGEGVAGE